EYKITGTINHSGINVDHLAAARNCQAGPWFCTQCCIERVDRIDRRRHLGLIREHSALNIGSVADRGHVEIINNEHLPSGRVTSKGVLNKAIAGDLNLRRITANGSNVSTDANRSVDCAVIELKTGCTRLDENCVALSRTEDKGCPRITHAR